MSDPGDGLAAVEDPPPAYSEATAESEDAQTSEAADPAARTRPSQVEDDEDFMWMFRTAPRGIYHRAIQILQEDDDLHSFDIWPGEGQPIKPHTVKLAQEVKNRYCYSAATLSEAQYRDPKIRLLMQHMGKTREEAIPLLREHPDGDEALVRYYQTTRDQLTYTQEGVLVREVEYLRGEGIRVLILLPLELQPIVLFHCHDRSGHRKAHKVLELVSRKFDWPSIRTDVQRYCRVCPTCQLADRPPRLGHTLHTVTAQYPNEFLQIDHLSLPETTRGAVGVLLMVDHFSKYVEAGVCVTKSAEETIALLDKHWFCRHGTPTFVHSDNGGAFRANAFREYLKANEVTQILGSPYYPKGQGLVERHNRSLLAILRVQCRARPRDWDLFIQKAVFSMNSTVHATTSFSPNALMVGGDKSIPLTNLFPNFQPEIASSPHEFVRLQRKVALKFNKIARNVMQQNQMRQKRNYDAKVRRTHELQVGDKALVYIPVKTPPARAGEVAKPKPTYKLEAQWRGPFTVIQIVNRGLTYVLENGHHAHFDNIRPFYSRPVDYKVKDGNEIITEGPHGDDFLEIPPTTSVVPAPDDEEPASDSDDPEADPDTEFHMELRGRQGGISKLAVPVIQAPRLTWDLGELGEPEEGVSTITVAPMMNGTLQAVAQIDHLGRLHEELTHTSVYDYPFDYPFNVSPEPEVIASDTDSVEEDSMEPPGKHNSTRLPRMETCTHPSNRPCIPDTVYEFRGFGEETPDHQ